MDTPESGKKDKEPTVRCGTCGSPEVQYAAWYNPNTEEVGDQFGSWNEYGSTYCGVCDDADNSESRNPHRKLVTYHDPDFESLKAKYESRDS